MVGLSQLRDTRMTTISTNTLRAADGIGLRVETYGNIDDPALVFAHGFGQTRQAWSATASRLAASGWHCLCADARGHGDSGWRDDGAYDFAQFIDDLALLARLPEQRPILIGASMGGLLGLAVQAEYEPFRALVLVDITPRWESSGVERILEFMRAHPRGFATLDEAAQAIVDYLPYRVGRKSPERLRSLLVEGSDGRLRWHWDPRLLDVAASGNDQQARLLEAARRIRVPTLLLSGEHSDVVSNATIAEFLQCVPQAVHVRVPRAAHMIVGDRNDAFTDALLNFIQPLRQSSPLRTRA